MEQIFFRAPFFMLLWREKAERRIKEYFNGCITMENISLKNQTDKMPLFLSHNYQNILSFKRSVLIRLTWYLKPTLF